MSFDFHDATNQVIVLQNALIKITIGNNNQKGSKAAKHMNVFPPMQDAFYVSTYSHSLLSISAYQAGSPSIKI